jgi:signal transduction histidine kinase
MKLWVKIFAAVFTVSMAALSITGAVLINSSHVRSVEHDIERSATEFDLFLTSIEQMAMFNNGSYIYSVVEYNDYYRRRGVYFALIEQGELTFCGAPGMSERCAALAYPPDDGSFSAGKGRADGVDYIIMSSFLPDGSVLIYMRDVSATYDDMRHNIRTMLIILAAAAVAIAAFAWLISRYILRPLNRLSRMTGSIADGIDYELLPEDSSEVGRLSADFNRMSLAVHDRENRLRELADERQLFIDDMSHEMNTPLASIQGYAELLQNSDCDDGIRRKAVENIVSETRRIRGMCNGLMTLTIAREQELSHDKVWLEPLFRDVTESLRDRLADSGITVISHCGVPWITGDRTLIYIAVSNLVRNAVNYSEGGSVMLSSYYEFGKKIIEVSDDGVGIPPDQLEKVTNPFYRVDKSRSRATGGCGLGLSICSKIAAAHSAQMSITSKVAVGTTVKLIFPEEFEKEDIKK